MRADVAIRDAAHAVNEVCCYPAEANLEPRRSYISFPSELVPTRSVLPSARLAAKLKIVTPAAIRDKRMSQPELSG
jgi:hypothetical protein